MFKRRRPLNLLQRVRQFVWPREGWTRAMSYIWLRTLRLHGSAHSVALGLAIGSFISASPFLGAHILLGGLIAWMLGGNIIASAIGTLIGNPISFPFIWIATYQSGIFLLGLEGGNTDLSAFSFELLWQAPLSTLLPLITPMSVGMFPIGLLLGIATYYPGLWVIKAYKRQRSLRVSGKSKPSNETDSL